MTHMETIYLDHAASTPIRPEVHKAMTRTLFENFGNPSSQHSSGRKAKATLEKCRQKVANALGADRSEIYFVRGGTESNNLAILGKVQLDLQKSDIPRVITCSIEHKAVLDTCANAVKQVGELITLPVSADGNIDLDDLEAVLKLQPTIISIMAVNNETGLRLPIKEIAEISRSYDVPMHTDAVQACGRVPIDLSDLQVDLLSLSGHKICGPKGTGILFVRKGTDLSPMLFGGGQEKGIRPGTQDVAGAVGISKAIELSVDEQESECIRLAQLRDALEKGLSIGISDLKVYGEEGARAPHILNVGIADLDSDALLANLDMDGISVSSGSACNSGISSKSHVLKAIYNDLENTAIIRFSLGLSTTLQEIQETITTTKSIVLNMKTH